MSTSTITRSSRIRKSGIVVGLMAIVALVIAFTSGAFAGFTASDDGTVSVETATVTLALSDADNTGTFALRYENLVPGDSASDTFTVTNNSTVPVSVKVSGVGSPSVTAPNGPADLSLLSAQVDSYLAFAPVTSVSLPVNLGNLDVGESRTYTVQFALDASAGNEWQDAAVTSSLTVTVENL